MLIWVKNKKFPLEKYAQKAIEILQEKLYGNQILIVYGALDSTVGMYLSPKERNGQVLLQERAVYKKARGLLQRLKKARESREYFECLVQEETVKHLKEKWDKVLKLAKSSKNDDILKLNVIPVFSEIASSLLNPACIMKNTVTLFTPNLLNINSSDELFNKLRELEGKTAVDWEEYGSQAAKIVQKCSYKCHLKLVQIPMIALVGQNITSQELTSEENRELYKNVRYSMFLVNKNIKKRTGFGTVVPNWIKEREGELWSRFSVCMKQANVTKAVGQLQSLDDLIRRRYFYALR